MYIAQKMANCQCTHAVALHDKPDFADIQSNTTNIVECEDRCRKINNPPVYRTVCKLPSIFIWLRVKQL